MRLATLASIPCDAGRRPGARMSHDFSGHGPAPQSDTPLADMLTIENSQLNAKVKTSAAAAESGRANTVFGLGRKRSPPACSPA